MFGKVLYFPYINVPSTEWFTRVLLYWDQIGSIVPSEYVDKPGSLSDFMQELIKAELVKPVVPNRHIHKIPNFEDTFFRLIKRDESVRMARKASLERGKAFRIHIEKLGSIAYQLCDMGLAREEIYPWYEVERTTASFFMAYLASVLGKVEELDMEPITDKIQFLGPFTRSPDSSPTPEVLLAELRCSILEGVLPAPVGGVSVAELAAFKGDNSVLLRGFRRNIEKKLLEAAAIPDNYLRNRRLAVEKEELGDCIEELRARMHERRWPKILVGALGCLMASSVTIGRSIATRDYASAARDLPALVEAIFSAFSGCENRDEILGSPVAYAAIAQERFH